MIIDGGLPADWHVCAARSISGRPRVRIRRFCGARSHNHVFVNPPHASPPLPSPSPSRACPQLVRVKCHRDRDAAPRGVVILGTALLINNANPALASSRLPPSSPPLLFPVSRFPPPLEHRDTQSRDGSHLARIIARARFAFGD